MEVLQRKYIWLWEFPKTIYLAGTCALLYAMNQTGLINSIKLEE